MASTTDIGNLALSRIGHNRFMSSYDDDATTEADLIRLHYPLCRDALLRSHPWNFAIKRVDLAQVDETPAFEFDYVYQLPTDCLKVIRTEMDYENVDADYRIEGRKLLCNESTCAIEYVYRVTDTTHFDSLFIDALSYMIAAEVAMPLINDANAAAKARQEFDRVLREARSVDAQEGKPRPIIDSYDWLQARV